MKIYTYPSKSAETRLRAIEQRTTAFRKKDIAQVNRIVEDVRKHGDDAVIRYVNRFDAPRLDIGSLRVSDSEFKLAGRRVDRTFSRALNRAVKQITAFHKNQVQRSWIDTDRPGTMLGQLIHPVDSAGVYVPGGTSGQTPLVSSVLMGAIPAKIAGVDQVIMVTPPQKDGTIHPYLLVAARKVGVDAVFKMGSAWAIAALAYGTPTVPRVDVVVGPGNIYVTLAKKIVAGTVAIDMIAGPSEILVIADEEAKPEFVAADLLSQAEHDALSSAILITDSRAIAEKVAEATMNQCRKLSRRKIAEKSLSRFGAILVTPNLDTAMDLANRIAPEHLELQIRQPFDYLGRIRHAGAIFMGEYTPEPVGDYIAGPNHVLPTAGTARFSSALSVDHFVKKTSLIHYSRSAFHREAKDIIRLTDVEGLDAHGKSVQVRLDAQPKTQ